MRVRLGVFVWVVLLGLCSCTGARTGAEPREVIGRTRAAFAAGLARVKPGMAAEEVRGLVGMPDDVQVKGESGRLGGLPSGRERWCYGTDRHLGFATLGAIVFDDDGRVLDATGTKGAGELVKTIGERELRRMLRLLARANAVELGRYDYNPRDIIAAINAIYPLGRKAGAAVMHEYLDIQFIHPQLGDGGLYLVMRGLFEVVPGGGTGPEGASEDDVIQRGYFRTPGIPVNNWVDDSNHQQFPLFPLVLVDDIPLVPTGVIDVGGGPPEPAGNQLEALEASTAGWRQRALKPPADPLAAYAKLMAQLPVKARWTEQEPALVSWQLLRLVDTVYRDPAIEGQERAYLPQARALGFFDRAVQKMKGVNIHWDERLNCYVFADGSVLPSAREADTTPNPREVEQYHFEGDPEYWLQVVLERVSNEKARVYIAFDDWTGRAPEIGVRVFKADDLGHPLVSEPAQVVGADVRVPQGRAFDVKVAAGTRLQVELVRGEKTFVTSATDIEHGWEREK